ncbi:hypothetical protein BDZ45DRAFT_681477 [Acephala macrosclerotiorum]|nr:hypothetical protein BDZ45DRAFT_681477 [Acephala macrosclerotiorum]
MSKGDDPPPPAYSPPQNPSFQPGPATYTNGHPLQQQPYTTTPNQQAQPSYQQDVCGIEETRVIVVEDRPASGGDLCLGCCAGCAAACCCCGCLVM